MLINVIGALIFGLSGWAIFRYIPRLKICQFEDYQQFPTIQATVGSIHTLDSYGERWYVRFRDYSGKKCLAMDDCYAERSFRSVNYQRPNLGDKIFVYYWTFDSVSEKHLNGETITHYFHFCDERYYDLARELNKKRNRNARYLGVFLMICSVVILFFGNG